MTRITPKRHFGCNRAVQRVRIFSLAYGCALPVILRGSGSCIELAHFIYHHTGRLNGSDPLLEWLSS